MIISASRRTDIPAFFGKYFYNSLTNGEFKIINPFNRKVSFINFSKKDIDGIVFWSKNPAPFFKYIKNIKKMDYKFYFHFTLNFYPENIEPFLPNINERINTLNKLHDIISPNKIIWRYDPIILTNYFNINFHKENFEFILNKISHNVDKIIVSILTLYRKIKKSFPDINEDKGMEKKVLYELNKIAQNYGKNITTCCYKIEGIKEAKCIDASIFNNSFKYSKHYGQRKSCNCDKSIDIGDYRTCKYKCLYCYAR